MGNSMGRRVILTLFGESHGGEIGGVLEGMSPGIKVDFDMIRANLAKRRPNPSIDTARSEKDDFRIASGVFNGLTTGAPICMIIRNSDVDSSAYERMRGKARPSHADYAAFRKYHGFEDYRGGGHFSGRLTAPIVGLGSIALGALRSFGICIGTHALECAGVLDRTFASEADGARSAKERLIEDIALLEKRDFPTLSDADSRMIERIKRAKADGDSVGGVTETAICGLPAGLGGPWFSSVEGAISNAMFSIGGVKGIEFGLGFGFAGKRGSEANDAFAFDGEDAVTLTNNNGGINGGITNGMPIVFRCAVKPTPSISIAQKTIDFLKREPAILEMGGRHDPAIIRRACIVMTCLTAIVSCDLLMERFGEDCLSDKDGKWNMV